VGDLPINFTEHRLLELFRPKYSSVFMAKIITDPTSKASKGYGFVKFGNLDEANKAITEMNGMVVVNKTIKVSHAHQKGK
jgi:RNA recognition motif-containing protein